MYIMWLLSWIGVSVVVGTVVGIAWRLIEDYLDKSKARAQAQSDTESEPEAVSTPQVNVSTDTCACMTCPCPHTTKAN